MVTSKIVVSEALSTLQLAFKAELNDRVSDIEKLWASVINKQSTLGNINQLYRLTHNLVGSSGAFGAVTVSDISRDIEKIIKKYLNQIENKNEISDIDSKKIEQLLSTLKQASYLWEPSAAPCIQPIESNDSSENNLIYLVEDDELLAADIVSKLESKSYQVLYFKKLSEFELACETNLPFVIIMDIVFGEGEVAGAEVICRLQKNNIQLPPVIFVSTRNDIEARLVAARAGARRYFSKPIDMSKLLQTLDGLTDRVNKKYRVLIIDDDEALLELYETILSTAEMEVAALNSSLKGLEVLSYFKPDVIVLDVYMPDCSGLELAQIIRQDDDWSLTPIVFLSTETDLNRQSEAINLGGDKFLVKPVDPDQLILAIISRAKRARWVNKLNTDLLSVLRENEFQLISMNQHNAVSESDIAGNIIRVNEKFSEISGYKSEELLGENHRLLKSGMHQDSFYSDMWEEISHGRMWKGSICNRKKNGELYWINSTIVPFLNDKGKPYKYVSIRTDISELRKITDRLNQSQEFANIGSWDWNIVTGDLHWSDHIWPLFGYTREITNTTYDNFIAAIHPEDREKVSNAVQNCIETNETYDIEHRVIWMDGSVHWLHESGNVIRNENDEPINMLGIVRNIDEKKLIEQQLTDAKTEAENANRAKSKFLSHMSHEFRTPMNAIMGYGQLLKMDEDEGLSESQIENVDEILEASNHLVTLIDEVLSLAKIESGGEKFVIEKINICTVISDSLHMISHMVVQRNISIVVLIKGVQIEINQLTRQSLYVSADKVKLKQVMINLLSNAVKYNRENGILTVTCDDAEQGSILVSVVDQGKGLTTEQQYQLFNSFHRLGAEETNTEGTGIGLVITKSIVEKMDGKIGVTSEIDKGSCFWVELQNFDFEIN